MKHVLIYFLLMYSCSAYCVEGLQVRAEGKHPFKDTKAGTIVQYGSGVYVKKHLILTCYHVVNKGVEFEYKVPGKEWIKGRLYAWDSINDMALIETEAEGIACEFANIPKLTISGSAKNEPVHETSLLMNNATLYQGPYDETKGDCSKGDCDSTKLVGSSGSPIFAEGRLIGMVKTQLNRREKGYHAGDGDAPPGIYVIITSVDVIEKFLASADGNSN